MCYHCSRHHPLTQKETEAQQGHHSPRTWRGEPVTGSKPMLQPPPCRGALNRKPGQPAGILQARHPPKASCLRSHGTAALRERQRADAFLRSSQSARSPSDAETGKLSHTLTGGWQGSARSLGAEAVGSTTTHPQLAHEVLVVMC